MIVGILTNTYPPDLNGVCAAVKNLKSGLEDCGIRVVVATPKIEGRIYSSEVFPIRAIATNDDVSPDLAIPYFYINQVTEFFRREGVTIIHTHDTMIGGPEGIAIAAKLNVPCIHTFHTFIEQYPYLNLPLRNQAIRKMIRIFLNNYNHITAPSIKVYKYLSGLGVRTHMTNLVNVTGCNDLEPMKYDVELGKIIGLNADDFVFLTFCRVAKEKSVEVGLIALLPVLKKHPNTKYIIAGQGPEVENLQTLVTYLGINSQVIFTGKYELNDLNALSSLASVFIFTSHTENLPTNLLEAMSLGLPVISVDDEAVRYLLKPEENGYVGSVDQMTQYAEYLYQNPDRIPELSANARQTAVDFQNQNITQKYIDLYIRVADEFAYKQENPDKKINRFYKFWRETVIGLKRK